MGGSCQLYHRGGDSHGEEVLVGTFSLNEHPIIILFDSGASHDFISSTCAKNAMLSMVATEAPYVISTPRAGWMQIGLSVKPHSSLPGECSVLT
jgi:hypothetical protein